MKNESKDVLFRIPKSHYFRTRYREMSIPMAPSSEIFIDDISKKSLIFKEKGLDLIGNLTLTAYNSELGDKLFNVKQQELDDVKTKVVILYSDVKCCTVWNSEAIEKRAERLSNIIVKLYPIEQPTQTISFADPRYQEYTCEDPDNATYKVPNYYVLQGERVNTNNFAEMLRSIISKLYEQDSNVIKEMARKNEHILSWSQNVMFSYDVEKSLW